MPALLTTEEVKSTLGEDLEIADDKIEAIIALVETKTLGLQANRDEILGELKAAKAANKPFIEAGVDVDELPRFAKLKPYINGMSEDDFEEWVDRINAPPPDPKDSKDAKELQEVLDQHKAQHRKDVEEMRRKMQQEIEAAQKNGDTWRDKYDTRVKSSHLDAAFERAGVRSATKRKLLVKDFIAKADWDPAGDKERVQIDHLDCDEAIERWSKTPEGREFVDAPINSGGGATGGNGKSSAPTVTNRSELLGPANRRKMIEFMSKHGREAYNALPP